MIGDLCSCFLLYKIRITMSILRCTWKCTNTRWKNTLANAVYLYVYECIDLCLLHRQTMNGMYTIVNTYKKNLFFADRFFCCITFIAVATHTHTHNRGVGFRLLFFLPLAKLYFILSRSIEQEQQNEQKKV